jgi:hypothetical protein
LAALEPKIFAAAWATGVVPGIIVTAALGLFDIFDAIFGGGSDTPPTPRQLRHGRHPLYRNILGVSDGLTPTEAPDAPITCSGSGRGLSGNSSLVGNQGGIPGQTVQSGTAAVIPQQFGVSNGAALSRYASQINGTVGQASFSAVTDVIGGKSPIPGTNVRTALQQLNPGQLIIEIPGASDQGTNAPVTIHVPSELGCPTGTGPAAGN